MSSIRDRVDVVFGSARQFSSCRRSFFMIILLFSFFGLRQSFVEEASGDDNDFVAARVASDSQNEGYEACKALDGDLSTFWHSEFSNAPFEDSPIPIRCWYACGCVDQHPKRLRSRRYEAGRPFELRVDLGDVYSVSGVRYFPRNDGVENGRVGRYEVYALERLPEQVVDDSISAEIAAPTFDSDGVWNAEYGEPTVSGSFKGDLEEATNGAVVHFAKPVRARYIVFRAMSELGNRPFSAVAELEPLVDGVRFLATRSNRGVARKTTLEDALVWASDLTGANADELRDSPYFRDLVDQYNRLVDELGRPEYYEAIESQLPTEQSGILTTDRDPTDVLLRRVVALWTNLRELDSVESSSNESKELKSERALFQKLVSVCEETTPEDYAARFKTYLVLAVTRRVLMAQREELNFDRLLFVKRYRSSYSHLCDQFYGRSAMPGGGLYTLDRLFGDSCEKTDLIERLLGLLDGGQGVKWESTLWSQLYSPVANDLLENSVVGGESRLAGSALKNGAFIAPELSFDGKKIAFAWCECVGSPEHVQTLDLSRGHTQQGRCYHIFTCDVDGSNLRQITDGTWNDFDPCFLPNGRMAFISERRGGYLRCGRDCPNYTLFDMNLDGSKMRPLSMHETNEWAPSVSNDGLILWTRWDYIDRFGCIAHGAWTTTPDGRNPRAICGNYAPRHQRPDAVFDIRAIPDSNKYIATAGPHHGQSFGSIIEIDPNAPDDPISPITRMTPDVGFPESQNGAQVWGTPWALAEDLFLAVADYSIGVGQGREGGAYLPGDYGIYLVDAFGNRELIYRDPEIGASTPIPLVSRVAPPIVPSLIDESEIVGQSYVTPPDFDAPRPQAVVAIQNVNVADRPRPNDAKIAAIRVVQVFCMSVPSGSPPYEIGVREASATDSVKLARRVWGVAPVEEDGSASFYVPADCELYFQTLDEDGLVLQSMRSGVALRPNERLACVGCHESRETASAQPTGGSDSIPLAFRREPSKLQSEGVGTEPVNFPELVQPILDLHCVECHAKDESVAADAPDLSRTPSHGYYASYWNLVTRGFGFTDYGDSLRTIPEKFGARGSKLLPLVKDHYGVSLSEAELKRIALWLDTTSNFYGVYEKDGCEKEFRGERAVPTLE